MTVQRLPAGHHGLPRSFVAHNQRERILVAVADAVADKGYPAVTVRDVVRRAAVSQRTFYEHFPDKREAFLAAVDTASAEAQAAVVKAFVAEGGDWPHQIRAGVDALLRFIADEPAFARMAYVDVATVGPEGVARHDAVVASFAVLLSPGFALAEHPVPPQIGTMIGGGINELVAGCVLRGAFSEIPDLLPAVVYMCLLPFVGPQMAAREAAVPAAARTRSS